MRLAFIMTKVFKEEQFDEDDWNTVACLACEAFTWLYENSRVERTPESTQIHIQPKNSKSSHNKKDRRKD